MCAGKNYPGKPFWETPKLLVNWDISLKQICFWMQKLELRILKIWLQIRIPRPQFNVVNLYNMSLLSLNDPSFIGMQRWRLIVSRFTRFRPMKRWTGALASGGETVFDRHRCIPNPHTHTLANNLWLSPFASHSPLLEPREICTKKLDLNVDMCIFSKKLYTSLTKSAFLL